MFILRTHQPVEIRINPTRFVATSGRLLNALLNEKPRNQSELSQKLFRKRNESKSKNFKPNSQETSTPVHKPSITTNIKLIQSENLFNNVDKKYRLKEEEKMKFTSPQSTTRGSRFLHEISLNEKEFLNRASFNKHNSSLDEVGKSFLNQIPSLGRASVDPKHMTLLHNEVIERTAMVMKSLLNPDEGKRIFVELNPGVGLLTKKLIETFNKADKFLLIESQTKFMPYLNELTNDPRVKLVADNFFNKNFAHQKVLSRHFNSELRPIIYGVLPWNEKGFFTSLFSDYAMDRRVFGSIDEKTKAIPEFLLYIPEVTLAKLNPKCDKKYLKFSNRMSTMSTLFSKCQILAEEEVDYFFPYPQVSNPFAYTRYPFSQMNTKKMYLVHFQFKASDQETKLDGLIKHKRLFHQFTMQLYARPSDTLRNSLNNICKDMNEINKEVYGLKGGFLPVREYNPYQIFLLFKTLLHRPELIRGDVDLERLLNKHSSFDSQAKYSRMQNRTSLNDLKMLNKNLTGQLMIPNET